MKGQTFIMGALIFSSLILLVFISTGPKVLGDTGSSQSYFSNSLNQFPDSFNSAIKENRSTKHLKESVYRYDRFLERRSLEKGINYRSYTLVLLPEKGEAVFVNYFPESLEIRLKTGSWINRSVPRYQSFSKDFTGSFKLVLPGRNESYSATVYKPRFWKHSVMEASDERWENTLVG